jgi:hypothetical protein
MSETGPSEGARRIAEEYAPHDFYSETPCIYRGNRMTECTSSCLIRSLARAIDKHVREAVRAKHHRLEDERNKAEAALARKDEVESRVRALLTGPHFDGDFGCICRSHRILEALNEPK